MKQAVIADQASVSRLAYQLWENAGRPAGRDLEFWLAAEAHVRTTVQQPVASATEAVSPAVKARGKIERVEHDRREAGSRKPGQSLIRACRGSKVS